VFNSKCIVLDKPLNKWLIVQLIHYAGLLIDFLLFCRLLMDLAVSQHNFNASRTPDLIDQTPSSYHILAMKLEQASSLMVTLSIANVHSFEPSLMYYIQSRQQQGHHNRSTKLWSLIQHQTHLMGCLETLSRFEMFSKLVETAVG